MAKEVYIKTYKTDKSYSSSLLFDGTNDYISLPNLGFSGNVDISVEAWIYVTNLSSSCCIFSFSTEGTTRAGFGFSVNGTPNAGLIQLFNWADDCNSAVGVIQVNTWYHVACTYEATTRIRKVYVNGSIVAQSTAGANLNLTNASYSIGKRVSNTDYFRGYIQDVRIWNVVRTQSEISQNAFIPLTGTETGLVAWYKLNEGTGTTATDTKGGYNGTLTNFPASPWQGVSTYIAPIYSRTYKGFSVDYSFNSIHSNINSGYGSLDFTIPREFDVLKSQDPQDLSGYELDVIAYDNQETSGITLFSGDVSIVDRKLSGNDESVSYTATTPLERIEKIDLEDTDSIVAYSSTEIATIMRDIIDKANFKAKKQILKYTTTSIATTGKTISITFSNSFVGDALKKVFQFTPQNYIFYIDTDKTVYLKTISATPDHYFYMSKDITEITRNTDKTKIINVLKLWDGEASPTVLRRYYSQGSIDTYGYSAKAERDGRFTTTAGALEYGTRQIYTQQAPNDQFTFNIVDSSGSGYNIDKIKVGDTFKIQNLNTDTSIPTLLVITSKTDYLDYCTITASDRETYIFRELTDLKKDQFQVNNENHPATAYTDVAV